MQQPRAVGELGADAVHGAEHALVVVGHEAHHGQLQQGGVHVRGAVVLHERAHLGVVAAGPDLVRELVPVLLPGLHVTGQAVDAHRVHTRLHGGPHHHARVRVVLGLAAHLPDALVLLLVVGHHGAQQRLLQRPREVVLLHTAPAQHLEHAQHVPGHVRLVVAAGGVAVTDGPRALVARQVHQALANLGGAVQRVDVRGVVDVPGHRAQQPVAQLRGLAVVTVVQHDLQGRCRVTGPREPVVPVALRAHDLRQGRGGGADQPARGLVHQSAHHQQAAPDEVRGLVVRGGEREPAQGGALVVGAVPVTAHVPCRGALGGVQVLGVRAGGVQRGRLLVRVRVVHGRGIREGIVGLVALRPLLPQGHGGRQRLVHVHRLRGHPVGREPREREVPGLTGRHRERARVAALGLVRVRLRQRIAVEDHGVRTGHAHQHGLGLGVLRLVLEHVEAAQPRHGRAVVEAQPEVLEHLHLTREALHPADQLGAGVERHEVRDAHRAGVRGPHRVQHERVLRVEALHRDDAGQGHVHRGVVVHRAVRREQPAAVVRGAQQGREQRRGVEARHAPPVHRPVAGDQRPAAHVGQQGVVLDL